MSDGPCAECGAFVHRNEPHREGCSQAVRLDAGRKRNRTPRPKRERSAKPPLADPCGDRALDELFGKEADDEGFVAYLASLKAFQESADDRNAWVKALAARTMSSCRSRKSEQ